MRARLKLWIGRIFSSFWFLPLLMVVLTPGLVVLLLLVDRWADPGIYAKIPWAYSGGAVGARALLTTIAGAMITAASVTFSLASVALSIASQQYGSRVLRNYLRDRITQVLLGTFISTFIYSVLVVWDVRGSSATDGFVPAISVTVAIALALGSLVLLIFFVHHISISVQASHQLLLVSRDLLDATGDLYPGAAEKQGDGASKLQDEEPAEDIFAEKDNYLQTVALDMLVSLAQRNDLLIQLHIKPGDYYISRHPLAQVFGARRVCEEDRAEILRAFVFGGERTPEQDIRYQFQQIAEIVIRSMSPAINDPFIAATGIDQLASGICHVARRPRPSQHMHDSDGELRLVLPVAEIPEILESTVGHIAVYASNDPFIMNRLQALLDTVGPDLRGPSELEALAHLRHQISRAANAGNQS